MASSIETQDYLEDPSILGALEIHIPKPTAIDKVGGILCHICDIIIGNKKEFDIHFTEHKIGGTGIIYTCVKCNKQIPNYPSFRGHCYLNHVVKNKFQCNHCTKSFCKLSVLNTHVSTVHNYKCSSCEETFTSKKLLDKHKFTHNKVKKLGKEDPPYDCTSCGKVIQSADICESHIEEHCEIRYPCPICNEILPNKIEATKHLTKHFNEILPSEIKSTTPSIKEDSSIDVLGGIVCCHCDSLFRNRSEIDSHFMLMHNDKTILYTCNICGKQYEKYGLFGDHCYYHITKERFHCDQCNKTFPRLSNLVKHTEAFHMGCTTDRPFVCNQCSHGFMTIYRLREHLRLVHEEEPQSHRCTKPGCTATFEKPRDLMMHQRDHTALLDTWCRQCGLQFVSLSSAEKHLDCHPRKHYSCPVCKREYREKHSVVKHIPVHFESVMHVCKVCGKMYGARRRLIAHLKSHADRRTYLCTYCTKSFLKPSDLKQHLNVHIAQKPHVCSICMKAFNSYSNWGKHLTRMHKLDKATIKRLYQEREMEIAAPKASPVKAESGIESAGSEMSVDLYGFIDSDDSADGLDWAHGNREENALDTICDPVSGELVSITDTVNAAIDRIDSLDDNLDLMSEFHPDKSDFEMGATEPAPDDASDIKAIVEHIDAMSGDIQAVGGEKAGVVSGMNVEVQAPQYAVMVPVDNATFNTNPAQVNLPNVLYSEPTVCLPEYGPDFTAPSSGLASPGLLALDDHLPHIDPHLTVRAQDDPHIDPHLSMRAQDNPHIDPHLTVRAQDDSRPYIQNNCNFLNATPYYVIPGDWIPPLITKVFQYEDSDSNRMFIF